MFDRSPWYVFALVALYDSLTSQFMRATFFKTSFRSLCVLLAQVFPIPLAPLWSSQNWSNGLLELAMQSTLVIESKCLVLSRISKKHLLHPKLAVLCSRITKKHTTTREKRITSSKHLGETRLSKSENIYPQYGKTSIFKKELVRCMQMQTMC